MGRENTDFGWLDASVSYYEVKVRPTKLRIGGQVVNSKTPKDRDVAMVFQSYALYPHMTVRENMGFALKLAKTPQNVINEKVEEAARILDLTQHLDRKRNEQQAANQQRMAEQQSRIHLGRPERSATRGSPLCRRPPTSSCSQPRRSSAREAL